MIELREDVKIWKTGGEAKGTTGTGGKRGLDKQHCFMASFKAEVIGDYEAGTKG